MSITLFYQCDRCGKSMGEPHGTLTSDDNSEPLHLCENCRDTIEEWIAGDKDIVSVDELDTLFAIKAKFLNDIGNKDNGAVEYGYIPHDGMCLIACPKCGHTKFVCYPQGVSNTAEYWTYEHVCEKCGQMVGITVKNDNRKGGKE